MLILPSAINGYISIFAFTSLVAIPVCIKSSGVGLKICAITPEIKSISKLSIKKRRSMIKKVLLRKTVKLNAIEVLISRL